jgi:hypothetical protein
MTVRKCGTCKHYEPAPIWRKGWCRNPILYSPQQSHLVGEDELDCDRGMGNHWEAIEQPSMLQQGTPGSYGYVPPAGSESRAQESTGEVVPIHFAPLRGDSGGTGGRGGDVNQFGGPGRPGGSGGHGDGGDDDRGYPPYDDPEGGDPERFVPGRQFEYQAEERYWTDYLRIAAPVLGVILMLGLVWFWIASLLGDPEEENQTVTPDVAGPTIVDDTPTPENDDEDGDAPLNTPIAVTTPTPEPTEAGNDQPTAIGPGATVVVTGTGDAGLNMRASPSTTADIQQQLEEGERLTVTGESVEAEGYTWWPVESSESTGFVVANFVQLATD